MSQAAWNSLAQLLTEPHACKLNEVFPARGNSLGFIEALGHNQVAASDAEAEQGQHIRSRLSGLTSQVALFESISRCPILAITGLLNSGKSSLLATYLSPENRPRVLRGTDNASGTHRFVLWLPSRWRDEAELSTTLVSFLADVFGHTPEMLDEDPDRAARQYNGLLSGAVVGSQHSSQNQAGSMRSPLSVPLVAYDDALNDLRVGLLDCPDIQTGMLGQSTDNADGEALVSERSRQMTRISRLCSAFIVVCRLGSLHDEALVRVLRILRDGMPGVPRLLAVNRVKARYTPDTVVQESRALVDRFGISKVYAAYDFRSKLADGLIPPAPPQLQPDYDGSPLPIFFAALEATDQTKTEYLHDLASTLDAGALARESGRSLQIQLQVETQKGLQWLNRNEQAKRKQTQDVQHLVAKACYEFMAERDATGKTVGLRLQTSPAIVAQMTESLQRTAPGWMKLSLKIDRGARQLQQAVSNSAARFKLLQSASESVTNFAKKFRRGDGALVVTPNRLVEVLRKLDMHSALQPMAEDKLLSGCECALKRFAAEDQISLDAQELDRWSEQVWSSMSLKAKLWKGTQPLAVVTAPLLAAVLVPFDGGGTAVLVFASTKELLAAAGLAAVLTPVATGGETLSIVQRETPWRQLSDLFAITCDCIGSERPAASQLPTAMCGNEKRSLLPSEMEVKPRTPTPYSIWQLPGEVQARLLDAIQACTEVPAQ